MNSSYDRTAGRWLARIALGTLVLCALACRGEPPARQKIEPGRAASPPGPSAETAQPAPAEATGPLVIFLGDSLSAGLHLPADEAFPAVLQRALARDGVPFRLVNAGVSGDTSAGGLGRVSWIMKQKPRVVVLELGANDGLRGLPLSHVEENLRALIGRIRGQGAQVLFLGMRLPPSFGSEYAQAFAALYDRVAKDTGVDYVPFFQEGVAGVPELNLPDGLHPTAEGHRRIAARLAPALRAVLARVQRAP